jgi:hypothetical protein
MQDPPESLQNALAELQSRRAERVAEREERQAQIADAPRALAEGRGAPGDSARLKAELSDLNDAVAFLDSQIGDVQGQIAAEEAKTQRDQTIGQMAEIARKSAALRTRLEHARLTAVTAVRASIRTMQQARSELVHAQVQFDGLGDTLVDGFSTPYRQTYSHGPPAPDIGAIQALVAEVEDQAGGMDAILNEWRQLGGEYSMPDIKGRRYGDATRLLTDLGLVGHMVDRQAGFQIGANDYKLTG